MTGFHSEMEVEEEQDRPCNRELTQDMETEEEEQLDPCKETEEEEQDPRNDRELPGEVVEIILARLPVRSLMRSRSVCREWNLVVSSRPFFQERMEWREGERDRVLLVVGFLPSSGIAACVYDRSSNCWHKVELPPWLQGAGPWSLELPKSSSGGGLVLSSFLQNVLFGIPYVGNPLGGSWVRLPQFPDFARARHVQGMWVDTEARSFKLVVAEMLWWSLPIFEEPIETAVFDSKLVTWTVTSCDSPLPDHEASRHHDACGSVFVGSVLFCLTHRCKLLAYDLEEASWRWLPAALPRPFRLKRCKGPVNVRGRLLCLVVGQDLSRTPCMEIWELDLARIAWTVVAAMPAPMVTHFCRPAMDLNALPSRIQGLHVHDIMVVAGEDEVYLMREQGDPDKNFMAALDLRETPGAWRWLPTWPYDQFESRSLHSLDPWMQFDS